MKKLIILILAFILLVLSYFSFFRNLYFNKSSNYPNYENQMQSPLSNPAEDIVNREIVAKLLSQLTDEESTPLLSWNTPEFGRLYATICSSPQNIFPCEVCTDAGTNFYDRNGDFIGNCFGMPLWYSDGQFTPEWSQCRKLQNLNYKDADYISPGGFAICSKIKE